MKVRIVSLDNGSQTRGALVYANHKPVYPPTRSIIFPREWGEDEIANLLTEREYKAYEKGKDTFEITKQRIWQASNDINYFTY